MLWDADDGGGPEALRAALANLPGGHPLRDVALTGRDLGAALRDLTPAPTRAVHFTGYYEPEIEGALSPSDAFPIPVHAEPPGGTGAPRAEIEGADLLSGHEVAWLRDPVDRFFLQVQGSGRVRLSEGGTLRLTHAAKNGHPYRSVGKLLVERGEMDAATITADGVKAWLRADPDRGVALMRENPSYVMFRVLRARPDEGPPGALGLPVTPGRTIAVDPEEIALGTVCWIEVDAPSPIRRLVVAQDVGSAIKGARADLFFGTGEAAGAAAGALNHPGRLVPLRP